MPTHPCSTIRSATPRPAPLTHTPAQISALKAHNKTLTMERDQAIRNAEVCAFACVCVRALKCAQAKGYMGHEFDYEPLLAQREPLIVWSPFLLMADLFLLQFDWRRIAWWVMPSFVALATIVYVVALMFVIEVRF
jgi:hypothetical protein